MRGGMQYQFLLLVDFMERYGDISKSAIGAQGIIDSQEKWLKLTNLLNEEKRGHVKTLEKWRKTWSDLKNNSRKKLKRIEERDERGESSRLKLTELERRILKIMNIDTSNSSKMAGTIDSDFHSTNIQNKIEEESGDEQRSTTTFDKYDGAENGTVSSKRKLSNFRCSTSHSTAEVEQPQHKRRNIEINDLQDVTEKYMEYEIEREKMLHEREMARIKQNDKLIEIFERMVKVIETFVPAIQKNIDRDSNDSNGTV